MQGLSRSCDAQIRHLDERDGLEGLKEQSMMKWLEEASAELFSK